MNNFEKRLLLDYLDKLCCQIDYNSYNFDSFFDSFLEKFRVKKSIFNFDSDGCLEIETIKEKKAFVKDLKSVIKELKAEIKPIQTPVEKRLCLIQKIFNMNDKEMAIFTYTLVKELNKVFTQFDSCLYGYGIDNFCRFYLGIRYGEKDRLLDSLYFKNLIPKRNNVSINSNMLKIFDSPNCNTVEKITATLLGEPEKSTLTLNDFSHIKGKQEKVLKILKSAVKTKAKGVNILLHGHVGTGKSEFSRLIANVSNVPLYAVKTEDSYGEEAKRTERLADLYAKQQILSRIGNACILFDEAEDVLNRGFGSDGTASKGYLNKIIETTPVPVIWTTNNIYDVDPAFLRRMTYCIEFEKLSEDSRLNIWNRVLKKNELTVSKEKVEELNKNYDIPPALINNAVKTTKMINGSVDDFEELIENVARVVDKKKVVKQEPKKSMGDYNVDLINANMDINALTEKIKSSNKLNFSMCLYGEPGTSKSSYARYLAEQLGIEVLLKRASDLISPYVGETEQNIATAFSEAKSKKAMLIFDEADTFLQDRNNAVRSWEVAQVNEMLTQMEATEYPFICTTNLLDTLDEASLRRFTFKIRFDFLTQKQANIAMDYFFGIKNSNLQLKGLTSGDFATVKKKVDFLGTTEIDEITKMLSEEVKVKKSSELKNTIGF